WAEPPGRPTLARTRTATTARSAPVPARSSSGAAPRGARTGRRAPAAERGDRPPAGPVVGVEGDPVRGGAGHGGLLPGTSRRPAPDLVGHAVREISPRSCARWSAGGRGGDRGRGAYP